MSDLTALFKMRMDEFQQLAEAHGFKNIRAWGHASLKKGIIGQKLYDSLGQLIDLHNSLRHGSGSFAYVSNDALCTLGTAVRALNNANLHVKKRNPNYILEKGVFRMGSYGRHRPNHTRTVYIKENVCSEIMDILGRKKPELGGMLGFSEDQCVIDRFVFDKHASVTSVEYNPSTDFLSDVINNEWKACGTYLAGFVHSHPGSFNQLSGADVEYACRIIETFELPFLFMPIVTSSYSYKASLTGYIVNPDGNVERCNVVESPCDMDEIDDEYCEIPPEKMAEIETAFNNMTYREDSPCGLPQDDTFARIRPAFDVDYMSKCTVIGIGCGGARSFYESMARMGVGHFILMDGDVATRSNIASQNGYLSEVGMQKPELVKRRILDINTEAEVKCLNMMLDDRLDDKWLEENILNGKEKTKCLVCAFTDSFHAQARISRIAVKYGLPFLSGQHHREGETSELVFWYPGLTQYSCRDILLERYKAYKAGYKNDVTSVGSPIFNTTRLNALCEKIAVGMLLYGNDSMNPYSRFLSHFR